MGPAIPRCIGHAFTQDPLRSLSLSAHLNPTKIDKTAKKFQFETMWMSYPDLYHIISKSWEDNLKIIPNIKNFTINVKEWNHTTFGNLFYIKRKILNRLLLESILLHFGYHGNQLKSLGSFFEVIETLFGNPC